MCAFIWVWLDLYRRNRYHARLSYYAAMNTTARLYGLIVALLLSACVTSSSFKVDAISAPSLDAGLSCIVVPADPQVKATDLRFMEAARYVQSALSARGFRLVANSSQADMLVTLDASIGRPENVTRTRMTPVYAEDGGYYRVERVLVNDKDGRQSYMRTRVWVPYSTRLIGTVDSPYTETIYDKRLSITAFDNRAADEGGDLPQLWSVVVLARDTNGDLRSVLPQMAYLAASHAGQDTGGQKDVSLREDEPGLMQVRGTKGE